MTSGNSSYSGVPNVRRRTIMRATGGALTAGLAGCTGVFGNGSEANNEITVLTYRSSDTAQEAWSSINESYEAETGNTVNMQYTAFEEVVEEVGRMIRGGNPPDVVMANMGIAGTLLAEGQLAPLTDIIDDLYLGDAPEENFIRQDGEVYVPIFSTTIHPLLVRRDIVEAAGESMPSDLVNHDMGLDEFADWGESIVDETDHSLWGYSSAPNDRGGMNGLNFLYTNGVHAYSGSTGDYEVVLDQGDNRERAVEALEYFRDDLAPVSTGGPDLGWTDMQELYTNSEVASINYGYGRLALLFTDRGMEEELENMVPMVQPHDNIRDDGGLLQQQHGAEMILAESQNQEAAKDWIRTFHNDDGLIQYYHTTPLYTNPPTPEGMEDEAWLDHPIIQDNLEAVDFYTEVMEEGYAHNHAVEMGDDGVNLSHLQAYDAGVYGDMLAYVTVDDRDPETAVEDTAEALRGYL